MDGRVSEPGTMGCFQAGAFHGFVSYDPHEERRFGMLLVLTFAILGELERGRSLKESWSRTLCRTREQFLDVLLSVPLKKSEWGEVDWDYDRMTLDPDFLAALRLVLSWPVREKLSELIGEPLTLQNLVELFSEVRGVIGHIIQGFELGEGALKRAVSFFNALTCEM